MGCRFRRVFQRVLDEIVQRAMRSSSSAQRIATPSRRDAARDVHAQIRERVPVRVSGDWIRLRHGWSHGVATTPRSARADRRPRHALPRGRGLSASRPRRLGSSDPTKLIAQTRRPFGSNSLGRRKLVRRALPSLAIITPRAKRSARSRCAVSCEQSAIFEYLLELSQPSKRPAR